MIQRSTSATGQFCMLDSGHSCGNDDDSLNRDSLSRDLDSIGADYACQPNWITRQPFAAIWIAIAWAVGTLVFELGVFS